jgi:AcrR family transcriptional regulator
MREREYEDITVKDLAQRAGVNRKTFYAHFQTKQELYESMVREMFEEIFYTFIYPKPNPGLDVDSQVLMEDIRLFFQAVDRYREELEVLVTSQTSAVAFIVAEQVILQRADDIRLMTEALPGKVPLQLYLIRIKSFFMMMIDWWLEQNEYSLEEAAVIMQKTMRKNTCSVFRYQRTPGL